MRFVVPVSLAALLIQAPVGSAEPRLAPVPESTWTDAQRALVARFGPAGRATNALRVYLHHPVLAENIMPFEQYISNESTLSPRHRELLILRTAWLCRSEYIWAQHAGSAQRINSSVMNCWRTTRTDSAHCLLVAGGDRMAPDRFSSFD